MATVDVEVHTTIDRPRPAVAAYCCDPANVTAWYANIKAVQWETEPPVTLGSRFRFTSGFLGRTLEYTYEVVELVPAEREGSVDEDLLEDSTNRIEDALRANGYRDAKAPHTRVESGGELVFQREVQYIEGGQMALDKAFGWGMTWARGRK
jgi:hypothetical protein